MTKMKYESCADKSFSYMFAPDAERLIEMVNATMAMESMPLTDEDRDRLRAILRGEITAEETVRQLVNKHKVHGQPSLRGACDEAIQMRTYQ